MYEDRHDMIFSFIREAWKETRRLFSDMFYAVVRAESNALVCMLDLTTDRATSGPLEALT